MVRVLLIFFGSLFLIIGVIGIVVPGLPATPFFLLTAGLYVRSSERLSKWVLSNRIISVYISDYMRKRGMSVRSKIVAISMMVIMIPASLIFSIESFHLQVAVLVAGIAGLAVIIFFVPTARKD
jgi:uncharacterized membrane protein YbaN (DUF454 family)